MTLRPVLGVSAYESEARWGSWSRRACLLPTSYLRAIACAGATGIVIPVGADARSVVDRIDGLVLAGGPDVDPAQYGAPQDPATVTADSDRDASEMALLRCADERQLPVLAICRGMQLLNVVRGGTLHQHLPEVVGTTAHQPEPGTFAVHGVRVDSDTPLAKALGTVTPTVTCHHHQAVDRVGARLRPIARHEDGTIEALEDEDEARILAVQWHPEEEEDSPLFAWLAHAAACFGGRSI